MLGSNRERKKETAVIDNDQLFTLYNCLTEKGRIRIRREGFVFIRQESCTRKTRKRKAENLCHHRESNPELQLP